MNLCLEPENSLADVTDEQLEERLHFWMKILRLDHWDIDIAMLEEAEYVLRHGNASNAKVRANRPKLMAWISVNEAADDPLDYILVHELVHVMMDQLETKIGMCVDQGKKREEFMDIFDDELELLTHQLSRAIITAYGERKYEAPKQDSKKRKGK